jgi:pyruvate ferredoxin oxidoreductase delta subunit
VRHDTEPEAGESVNVGTKDCGHEIAMATPSPGEGGATGEWREARPVLQEGRCLAERQDELACQLCWVFCPDVCIRQGIPPSVDLIYCKGCGICAEVCPVDAISMVSEDAVEAVPGGDTAGNTAATAPLAEAAGGATEAASKGSKP